MSTETEETITFAADEEANILRGIVRFGDYVHQVARNKGWWDKAASRSEPELIALMHSELSEALEEYRNQNGPEEETGWLARQSAEGKPEGLYSEYADVVIRILDAVAVRGDLLTFARVLLQKARYNATRPYRHGGKVC